MPSDDVRRQEITDLRAQAYMSRLPDWTAILDVLGGARVVKARAIQRFLPEGSVDRTGQWPFYVTPLRGMVEQSFAAYVTRATFVNHLADVVADAYAAFASSALRMSPAEGADAKAWDAWMESGEVERFTMQALRALLVFGRAAGRYAIDDGAPRLTLYDGVDVTNWQFSDAGELESVTVRKRTDRASNAGDASGLYGAEFPGYRQKGAGPEPSAYSWERISRRDGAILFESLRWDPDKSDWAPIEETVQEGTAIPVVIMDLNRPEDPCQPPLAAAAWENIAAFNLDALRTMTREDCTPAALWSGFSGDHVPPVNEVWTDPNADARLQGTSPSTGVLEDISGRVKEIGEKIETKVADLRAYTAPASGTALSIEAFQQAALPRAIFSAVAAGVNELFLMMAEYGALPEDGRPVAMLPQNMEAPAGFSSATSIDTLRELVAQGVISGETVVRYLEESGQIGPEDAAASRALARYMMARKLKEDDVLSGAEMRALALDALGEAGKGLPRLRPPDPEPGRDPLAGLTLRDGAVLPVVDVAAAMGLGVKSRRVTEEVKARAVILLRDAGFPGAEWRGATLEAASMGDEIPPAVQHRRVTGVGMAFVGLALDAAADDQPEDVDVDTEEDDEEISP